MAIGDFEALFGTSVQRLGFGKPESTIRLFHGIITVSPVTGLRKRAQERTINRGWHRRKGKPDKWEDIITVTWHMDIHRLMTLQAALYGAVTPTTLSVGAAYQQIITPDPSDAYTRFHTLHFNRNGRVYVHTDAEPLSMQIAQGDSFWDCTMEIGARYIAHNQAFPTMTVGPSTYNGQAYCFGVYNGGVNTAVTYNLQIYTPGTFGAAQVRTQKSGDTNWGTAQTIYEDKPISLVDETNADSGMYVVYTEGAAEFRIVNFANFGGDNVTVNVDGAGAVTVDEPGDFSAGASNAECAENLANAINVHAGLSTKVIAVNGIFGAGAANTVRVYPRTGYTAIVLTTSDVTGITVTTTTALGNYFYGPATINMVDYNQGPLDTVTLTVDAVPTVLTEGPGGDFLEETSNAVTATNIAAAINGSGILGPKVTAYAGLSGATSVVRVYRDAGYTVLTLATSDVTAWTVTQEPTGGADAWTDSSQGVVVAGTAPDHTVFSPNSFEIKQVTYGGADFDIEPNTMGFAFTRELQRDDYVLTSPYVRGYPKKGHVIATGSFKARSSGSKYIQDAASGNQRAILIMMEGQFLGASAYRERIQLSYPQIRLDPGVTEALNEDFVNYHECPWTAEASTDTLNDFFAETIYTDASRLDW